MFDIITECRICNSSQLKNVIDLGEHIITSRFPKYGDFSTPKTPISLCMCKHCGLLQLRHTTPSTELYEHEYGYRSGINHTMRTHLKEYHTEILSIAPKLNAGDAIIDIGCNDGTMLKYYSPELRRVGVDPTGKQFKEYYEDTNIELIANYFSAEVVPDEIRGRVKIVSSISMFYDLPDPVAFARDIWEILAEDGIWTCEQSYLLTMLQRNSIDTICHEHLEYYGLRQIKEIARRAGFTIVGVSFNDCNGGSFRVYFSKSAAVVEAACVSEIIAREEEYGVMKPETYTQFVENCRREANHVKQFIAACGRENVHIYGASTKGSNSSRFYLYSL